jgi:hypothetical protein
MGYTPELSQRSSATLRRQAWFRGKPMTKSLEMLIGLTAMKMAEIRPAEVCAKCRDDSICKECPFNTKFNEQTKTNSKKQWQDTQ